jgi:hypothetical protein
VTRLFLALSLTACAPTYRVASGRCPTTSMLLGDFALTSVALATSAVAYNTGHLARSGIAAGIGMSLAIGANLAETTCRAR